MPSDLDPGVQMADAAIEKMQAANDAVPASPPMGLGERGGEFDRIFIDAFQRIVLHGEPPRPVLDSEAETPNGLLTETGAACWQPDPPGTGACRAQ